MSKGPNNPISSVGEVLYTRKAAKLTVAAWRSLRENVLGA